MLTRIEALRFRSLRDVDVAVGSFHVLLGPNGSGKSTLLDVVGFLGDLLRVGLHKAIVGDAAARVPMRAADPRELCWLREGSTFELAIELSIPADLRARLIDPTLSRARYEVRIDVDAAGQGSRVDREAFWLLADDSPTSGRPRQLPLLFPDGREPRMTLMLDRKGRSAPDRAVISKAPKSASYNYLAETNNLDFPFKLGPQKSALGNLVEDESKWPVATWAKRLLTEGIDRIALHAESLRLPSPSGGTNRFALDGSNLPWVIDSLAKTDPEQFERWVEHVRTAIPDIEQIGTVLRDEDKKRYVQVTYRGGLVIPSWLVSDGTLRLLALTLLSFLRGTRGVYLIEEPENGIHPRAVETVYRALSSGYDAQVLCASHSPIVLGLAQPSVLLCFAKDSTGATDVVRGDRHPKLQAWKSDVDLGLLFAAGVLE